MTPKFPICSDVTFVYMNCNCFPVIPIVNQVQMLPTFSRIWHCIGCELFVGLLRIYPLTLTVLYTVKFILSMTNMWWRLKRRWIQMLTLLRWCLYTSIKDDALHQAVKDLHSRLLKAIRCSVHMLVVRINKALSNKTKETKILTNLSAMQ